MAFWLAATREGQDSDWIQRFDPRFWTVNFPRPMLAALTTTAPDALRVDATFLREGDLAGIIWDSVDHFDHPLLAYATRRDYARTTLKFRWKSGGVLALNAVNGPTLTIEGRDAAGQPRTWYVRLWNYAQGSASDAQITLDFSNLNGGFLLPAEADPVHPGDIDRMFISLVAPGYVAASTVPLAAPAEGWAEMSAIACEGHRAMLEIGDVVVPPHGLAMATAYDDATNQAPARLIRNAMQLGYRGSLLHYVGMSHFMRLSASGGQFLVPASGDPLCTPAKAWHLNYLTEAKAAGLSPILSLSYELFAQYCPAAWQQRAHNGDPARTGWDPPSALLSPASSAAMAWLQGVGAGFVALMKQAGVPVRFQIGEPWWWIMADGRPCLYDDDAKTAFGGSPVEIADLKASLSAAQLSLLDAAGALLASSTAALRDAVRTAAAPGSAEVLLLTFLPGVLNPAMPEVRRMNLPLGWASPAYDRLQGEDYDWLTAGAAGLRRDAYAALNLRLGYPATEQDYLAGFVLDAEDRELWRRIDLGLDEAEARQAHERFVWALPQVCRDGFVRLPPPSDEDDMLPFDDLPYPLALGRDAMVVPEFSTSVAVTASGFERRNSLWSNARLRFDVGPGIRSEAELGELLAFFRARRGAARGFRLRDPTDFSSNGMTGTPSAADQLLGTGDGVRTDFALTKAYGEGDALQLRRITRPVAASIVVSLDGVPSTAWSLAVGGVIRFASPPAMGKAVRAGYLFDVPVRFAEDKLEVSGAVFAAGEAPSVPVIEIREADA
ncbi:MAG: TIGR02217 family protein [Novosphingobium sp.]|nr:TIGR02217 family protein [Novosphingobium sp.]